MEESKIEKQNRMLKTILLLLLVPIVSVGSIAAYHFLTKPSDSEKDRNRSTVDSSDPNAGTASPSPTTAAPAATPVVVAVATPNPAATVPNSKIKNPSFPNPVGGVPPFVGRWQMMGKDKTIYTFEAPKKIGSSEVGLMRVTTPLGKSYDSNYTDLDRNMSRFFVNGTEYFYEINDNGETLQLDYDGNILRFNRIN